MIRALLCVILLAAVTPAAAHEATGCPTTSSDGLSHTGCENPEFAYAAAELHPLTGNECASRYGATRVNGRIEIVALSTKRFQKRVWCNYASTGGEIGGSTYANGGEGSAIAECPSDQPWDNSTKTCGNPCTDKQGQSAGAGMVKGSTTGCREGCEVTAAAPVQVCFGEGASVVCRGGSAGWNYSGNTCATEDKPEPETCVPIDGQTLCMKPDGSKCATASNGRQVCFGNGETGIRTDGSTAIQAGAGPTAPPPPGPTPGNDTLTQTGGPTTVTTTTNGTTNVVNITTWGTTHGTNAGTSNQGGDTGGTSGTPGGGSGSGSGGGDGGGEGECGEGEECDDGPGSPAGDGQYERLDGAAERTLSSVVAKHTARMGASSLGSMVGGFFNVSAGGSCPVWNIPATNWTPAIPLDFFCHSMVTTALQLLGYCILVAFGWAAFRWAFL